MACKGVPCYLGYKALPFLRCLNGTKSVMTGRCALREPSLFFFHLIKPINTFCAVIQNDSSDGSLQLVAPRMGKKPL